MQTTSKICIALVDDQNIFRQSLAALINTVDEFELIIDDSDGETFLKNLVNIASKIDIVIIDMDMPGINGIELNDILQRTYPDIKTIILSVHFQERLITQMIDAGANSYLAKNCDKDELIQAIKTVYATGFYFNHDVLNIIKNGTSNKYPPQRNLDSLLIKLTEREEQLLNLICQEYSNAEIADKIFLSVRTVEGHRNNLINKIGCRNTAGVVLFAIKNGYFKGYI